MTPMKLAFEKFYDDNSGVRAKEIARQKDQFDLNENHVSAQDLRIKNSFVKGVDFSRAVLITEKEGE